MHRNVNTRPPIEGVVLKEIKGNGESQGNEADTGDGKPGDAVRVAVNVRPLITPELLLGCTHCISLIPFEPQLQIGSHAFTFDYVFGNGALPCSLLFDHCVSPLLDGLFKGYNATLLAYGQTGSGKTYTMGTNYNLHDSSRTATATASGIIPHVMHTLFSRVDSLKSSSVFLIRVSFIEIFKEEVFDLLDPLAKPSGLSRLPIQIRESLHGGITLSGVTEPQVRSMEEMASFLARGSLSRATGSTNMNAHSSRSHAIFTISMEQKKIARCPMESIDDPGDDILCAKLHLVDLAGSERAKRTGADGIRLKEGIHINKGLLALGNVISALGDEKKRKGGHIPYRDSKLTRLLQDSLGGNSKTVMIACVSPADTNAEETLNTLKYANRARNIQNKAVINRDPVAAQMQQMRSQIEQLQSELLYYRADSSVSFEELQILKHKISLLEARNAELQRELRERSINCEHLSRRALDAQVEKDKLIMKFEAAKNGKLWDDIDSEGNQELDLVQSYVSKIQELEGELVRLQSINTMKRNGFPDCFDSDDEVMPSTNDYLATLAQLSSVFDGKETIGDENEIEEKELEHSSLQETLDRELKELDKKLQQKEAEMELFTGGETTVLKQHYEKKVLELEHEKKVLQKEIEDLRHKLGNISSSTNDDGTHKLKEDYLQKLNVLESQVSVLRKKQEAQAQLLRQKQRSDEAAKRLQDEIQRIKFQKVQLQNKIKQESEQFRMWKASREKEVLQLKKEGRRKEYEMHKLLALNQRQKMVLQRKTEEAAAATKKLKELLESRKTASRESSTAGNSNAAGAQRALMQGIEHELEVIVRVHEVRSQYERQMEERTKMAQEIAKLKEEEQMLKQNSMGACPETMSPVARNSRILALENMLATSSSALISMASQLSEAEERERAFSGRGRWNHVRSLAALKNLMNFLFNIASSSRCMVWDREFDCREKDSEIKELKEKVVKCNSLVRQLEKQNADLVYQMQQLQNNVGRTYDLRQGPRASGYFKFGGKTAELLEDTDTSESDHNSDEDSGDDEWVNSMFLVRKRNSGMNGRLGSNSYTLDKNAGGCLNMEESTDTWTSAKEKLNAIICCSCTKQSFCNTMKCECRASGGSCSASCGCTWKKCSNRDGDKVKVVDDLSLQDTICDGNHSLPDQLDYDVDLATQGAALLQSALAKVPTEQNEGNASQRKPLADIGNTDAKSNAPRADKRKKGRKSMIQLVPTAPSYTTSEDIRPPKNPENSRSEANMPLRLPRAMHSNINLLREKNTEQGEEPAPELPVQKEAGDPARRSPVRRLNKAEEKENLDV
ncbi:hypothetical protein vseg_009572 [Gypsophila vaccaria]